MKLVKVIFNYVQDTSTKIPYYIINMVFTSSNPWFEGWAKKQGLDNVKPITYIIVQDAINMNKILCLPKHNF